MNGHLQIVHTLLVHDAAVGAQDNVRNQMKTIMTLLMVLSMYHDDDFI